jgi:Xaa-Pro aminopeptidase
MLKLENCRERQQRLLSLMAGEQLDLAVLSNPKTIYYLSGALLDAALPHAFVMEKSGQSLLVTAAPGGRPPEPPESAAGATELYTWHTIERDVTPTTWSSEAADLVRKTAARILPHGGNVGIEFEFANWHVCAALRDLSKGELLNLTPALGQMRRQKDPDELECIHRTVALVEAGLGAVRSRLEAGLTEFQVYSVYYDAMVAKAETSVVLNGDFAVGERAIRGGGPPTSRKVQLGDLYIIDTFPTYQGYMCDYTRTFAVGRPSQLQQDAWGHVMEAHEIAYRTIRPGVPAREVYHAIKSHLDKFEPAKDSCWHHAGHGVGMSGWEIPWLTPGSDHVIQDREVLAVEPALYAKELHGGIRLEHNYLVTPEGVTTLDRFPMDLV